jgi:hypothetical protein
MAAKLTILVPLLGYWIIFNDHISSYVKLIPELEPTPIARTHTQSISSNLLMTYLGLCCLSLGTLLYQFWCPTEIKLHGSPTEFIADALDFTSEIGWKRIERQIGIKGADIAKYIPDKKSIDEIYNPPPRPNNDDPHSRRSMLELHYSKMNARSPILRHWAAGAYCVGFLLLAFPAASVFVRVLIIAWRQVVQG